MARTSSKVAIKYINLQRSRIRGGENLKITKSGVFFSSSIKKEIGLKPGDYVVLGTSGKQIFIGKKPKGVFGGHRISAQKNSERVYSSIRISQYGLPHGEYILGDAYDDYLETEQGASVEVLMYELIAQ